MLALTLNFMINLHGRDVLEQRGGDDYETLSLFYHYHDCYYDDD